MTTATPPQTRERRRIEGSWADVDPARDLNICDVLGKSVRARPDKTAVVFRDQRMTYRELDAAVRRVASQLEAIGVRDGEFVVSLGRNSAHLVALYFAIAHIGAVNVPLNPMLTTAEVL